eukprot:scaffold7173_cov179-Ochromonas_danica.AAC.1
MELIDWLATSHKQPTSPPAPPQRERARQARASLWLATNTASATHSVTCPLAGRSHSRKPKTPHQI